MGEMKQTLWTPLRFLCQFHECQTLYRKKIRPTAELETARNTCRGQGGSGGHGHKSSVQSKLDPDEELMVGELPIEMVDGGDKRP